LFSSLSKVNRELQLAKVDLEMANLQLHEIDDLKSSFIRVVTHELRTPLANMAFSLQILRMYGPQRWSSDQVEQVDQIESNLSLTRVMVDNLISFAAFLNKQVELNLEPLDFKTITSEILAPIKKVSDGKGIDLQVFFVGDLLPIRADRKLLGDAIFQLAQNAVKFTPKGGKIWITCWNATDLLYFDVKDTGVGVPREKLKSLWEGFSQVSDPNLRGQEGLGLGLALVRFIVAAHGGKVWVESIPGEGSTFGFRIPLGGPGAVIDPTSTVRNNRDITHPLRYENG
jgi:signal transduction histidine kinase